MKKIIVIILILFVVGCSQVIEQQKSPNPPTIKQVQETSPNQAQEKNPRPSIIKKASEKPKQKNNQKTTKPSQKVGVFYYPWYESKPFDGKWGHWEGGIRFNPPQDIAADYYPLLGAYSSQDPQVVDQHFNWISNAGIGVVVSSWWGPGDYTDRAISLLLKTAQKYNMKIAFLLEPRAERGAKELVSDIRYIYKKYGNHSAFYTTTATTKWNKNTKPKGLFFIWGGAGSEVKNKPRIGDFSYWKNALDRIHKLPNSAIVFWDETNPKAVEKGHFDGLYNYANMDTDPDYSWAKQVPKNALYAPSVMPGFSAKRDSNYKEPTLYFRNKSIPYQKQWQAAINTTIKPFMVTVSTFNEWHEGSQIEPAKPKTNNGKGFNYMDYEGLGSFAYLNITKKMVDKFNKMNWS